jgi:hypothetical protein
VEKQALRENQDFYFVGYHTTGYLEEELPDVA